MWQTHMGPYRILIRYNSQSSRKYHDEQLSIIVISCYETFRSLATVLHKSSFASILNIKMIESQLIKLLQNSMKVVTKSMTNHRRIF